MNNVVREFIVFRIIIMLDSNERVYYNLFNIYKWKTQ